MVILNSIEENGRVNSHDVNKNGCPYVYLIDNEQKMMLILKRDLDEIGGSKSADDGSSVQEFVTGKVQSLLDRVSGNGPLSLREMEVLNYAAMGKSNKQIAQIIGLSESTIKNHFSSTLRKLNANDRTHAVTLAMCNGWLNVKILSKMLVIEETAIGAASEY